MNLNVVWILQNAHYTLFMTKINCLAFCSQLFMYTYDIPVHMLNKKETLHLFYSGISPTILILYK